MPAAVAFTGGGEYFALSAFYWVFEDAGYVLLETGGKVYLEF